MRNIGQIVAVAGLSVSVAGPFAANAQQTASPSFRTAVEAAQSRLAAGDVNGAAGYVAGLSPSSPLEKYMAASLAMEIAVKRGEIVAQRQAAARILESGAVPHAQLPFLNKVAGYLSYQTGANDNAVIYLSRALELGDADPKTGLMLTETYVRLRKSAEAAQVLDAVIAKQVATGTPVPSSWYDRAASLAYARKDWSSLARYDQAKLAAGPIAGPTWRSAIAHYVDGAVPENEARLDMMRLQAAVGGLASERDYQGYAKLAADQGYSAEAKAVLEKGQETGALSRTDPVALSLMRSLRGKATVNLAATRQLNGKAASVTSGAKAAKSGDDLLANSQYAEAAAYYRAALEKGGADRDRVMTRYGICLARSGDLAGARAAFSQVSGGRWKDVAAFWSAWATARGLEGQAPASAS